MHDSCMRTSVTLDDDIYELAHVYAKARDLTLGEAIGELVRRGESTAKNGVGLEAIGRSASGFPVFKSRGRMITPEMVKAALEDEY